MTTPWLPCACPWLPRVLFVLPRYPNLDLDLLNQSSIARLAKGYVAMNETPNNKKKGISILQRLSILAILGIVLAIIFNYLR